MFRTVSNIFKIPDLRNKILFTVMMLIIYRVGFHIPIPGFNEVKMNEAASTAIQSSPLGRAAEYMQIFTGGTLEQQQSVWSGYYALYYRFDYSYAAR